jgi:hypothetical protein
MTVFNKMQTIKNPKRVHRCVWCSEQIKIGETHHRFVGHWEGEFQDWRAHLECLKAIYNDDQYLDSAGICNGPHARGGKCEC